MSRDRLASTLAQSVSYLFQLVISDIRDRERQREKQREKGRETDRERERQRQTETDRERERQRQTETDRERVTGDARRGGNKSKYTEKIAES